MLGDTDTGSLTYIYIYILLLIPPIILPIQFSLAWFWVGLLILSLLPVFFSDESEQEEGEERPRTQEEEDIDVIRSWVEVGGHPAHQEGEAKELLSEVNHVPISLSFHLLLTCLLPYSLTMSDVFLLVICSFPPSLQGLRLLQGASDRRKEAKRLEAEAEELEAEGWEKLREAITGSKAEGLYGLLRGVTSSFHPLPSRPLPSRPRISLSPSVHSQSPQEPTKPEISDPAGPATVPAPVAANPATEGDLPVEMQPLRIQLGGTKRVYQCRVEGCKEGPSTSRAAICSHVRRVHLGMGLVCPLCHKSFFNPDAFRHHKKRH